MDVPEADAEEQILLIGINSRFTLVHDPQNEEKELINRPVDSKFAKIETIFTSLSNRKRSIDTLAHDDLSNEVHPMYAGEFVTQARH